MCKHLDLYIVNSPCGDDKGVGKTTSKNVSTVDYSIDQGYFLKIDQFEVKEFHEMLSDIHCPPHLRLVSFTTSVKSEYSCDSKRGK